MGIANNLSAGFSSLMEKAGKPITIKYFSQTVGSVWEDDISLTEIAGSQVLTSGIVLPLSTRNRFNSEDVMLIEQGKLRAQDQRLYVNGSLDFTGTGSNISVKIVMGTDSFTIVPLGGIPYEVENTQIYKKTYIRILPTGSLLGEE